MKKNNQNSDDVLLSIQEISHLFDISKPTLRYYEDMGLIHTQRDVESNYRKYTPLSVIELSDIILYRNLNLSIKEIRDVMEMPISATEQALERACLNAKKEIEKIQHVLSEIENRKKKIRKYIELKSAPMHLVNSIDLNKVRPWNQFNPDSMATYMRTPYTSSYVILISDINTPSHILEGLATKDHDDNYTYLWSVPSEPKKYIECLLRTEYAYLNIVDLDNIVSDIWRQGYTPHSLIAKYLVSDIDTTDGKKYDYFQAWFEVS